MSRVNATILVLVSLLLAAALRAGERDLGTGYQLENVTVLDPNMRLNDCRRLMKEFNEALGLECRDCHDLKNFASDDAPLKLIAREMMKMERDINAQWFAGEPTVNCYTCHQGQRLPTAQPAVADADSTDSGE
ncbi:MAG: hypothetical protein DHS20C21_16010 [Gemmatimonadota bacterium]|nr:MAG: hypothetical protein DHS20C21_16010 [Gemmatimonadota bacterium]